VLEDDPSDSELLRRHLATTWPACEIIQVRHKSAYLSVLPEAEFDLILSDFAIPGFSGLSALASAREHCPDTPFIFVSGAIGDEVAVDSLKAGATDYVLKDRLARLVPAIERALAEAEADARRKHVEEQLRQSEEQYRDLFENATDLILSVTPEGRFLYVNRAWRQTLRYTEAEVAHLTIFDIVHTAYADQCRERFQGVSGEDRPGAWEAIFITKYGQNLYVEGNLGPRFQSGKLLATRGIFRDVTEKRLTEAALKRSIRHQETLVNSVDGIVWQADLPSLKFTFVSQQAERLLGYPARCWLEEPGFWQRHIHPEDKERVLSLYTSVSAAQKHRTFEYRMLAADGRVVWLRDMVSLGAEPGEIPKLQGIMVEVTVRKQAEEKLRFMQMKLQKTNEDLLQKNQEIKKFYHTLSHELKTPLTSAREFISILMDGLAGPLNESQLEFLGIAKDSCDQLRVCINDLLDTTRLETGKLTISLKRASLRALVQRTVAAMAPVATPRQITLLHEVDPGLPEVPLDENRITQVLNNLLNNAIRHTPAGGKIVVTACEAPEHPNLVQVSVSDSGFGIPAQEQGHIFDRLYQVKSGDAASDHGLGLGLYLCRELVQLHGGSIWVESEEGRGSTFCFVLPKGGPAPQDLVVAPMVAESDFQNWTSRFPRLNSPPLN